MPENPTFQIPRDVIEPIIQAHVSAAVVQAFGDHSQILKAAVDRVLNAPTDYNGRTPQYSSNSDRPWIAWMMSDCITVTVKE